MAKEKTGKDIVKQWFDSMEQVLQHEAGLAGLFEHGVSTGTAREFLVARVLRSFLPSFVHLGSGQIFSAGVGMSNQIDVIVYDPRMPFFEVSPGLGLYMLEGVIATVEVKSKLFSKGLVEALDNSLSVLSLTNHLRIQDNVPFEAAVEKLQIRKDVPDARGRVMASFMPRTYVFGYKGFADHVKMGEVIQEWFQRSGNPGSISWPALPRVVVAGDCAAMARDEGFPYVPDEAETAEIEKTHGGVAVHAMLVGAAKLKFGLLAVHLLRAVVDRLGISHSLIGVNYDLYPYLPDYEYMEPWAAAGKPRWVVRDSNRPLPEKKPKHEQEEED